MAAMDRMCDSCEELLHGSSERDRAREEATNTGSSSARCAHTCHRCAVHMPVTVMKMIMANSKPPARTFELLPIIWLVAFCKLYGSQ